MTIKIEKFNISSNGFNDFIDITQKVQGVLSSFGESNALVSVSTPSSTASIITFEGENGLKDDFNSLLEELVPLNKIYSRDLNYYEGNATSHLKAAFLKNNITLNLIDSKLELAPYQKIIFLDFDLKPQIRTVIVSIAF